MLISSNYFKILSSFSNCLNYPQLKLKKNVYIFNNWKFGILSMNLLYQHEKKEIIYKIIRTIHTERNGRIISDDHFNRF